MTLAPGDLLNNRFRIESILAMGGMGAVYSAIDNNLGVSVAVKENLFLSDEYSRQFQREASILASLRHPNLVRVIDYFSLPNMGQYLIMDYIEGEDLRQRIERLGSVSDHEVILIGAVVCNGLAYLHSRRPPVVHRDIKPGNIKITPDGDVVLVDFGLAKIMEGSQATTTGARAMTPGYSPPEQYGTARTDSRTDIYSLGATLYASLTGVIPEDGLARATGKARLTNLRKLQPKVNRKLAVVVEKSLAIEPEDRYQTAEEFKEALLESGDLTHITQERIQVSPSPMVLGEISEGEPKEGTVGVDSKPTGQKVLTPRPPIWKMPPTPSRRRRRRQIFWLSSLIIFFVAVLGVFLMVPEIPRAIFGWNSSSGPSPTPTVRTPTIENTLATPEIHKTTIIEPSNTPTKIITATATKSPTPVVTATLLGGGWSQIAFASDRGGDVQIWLMDSNGANLTRVTDVDGGACQPAWSPDGMKLLFITPCQGRQNSYPGARIYIMNVDGSDIRSLPLPPNPEGDFDPTWSPDGKYIAFTSIRSKNTEIYLFDVENETIRNLSNNIALNYKQPAWSPDGKKLAVVRGDLYSQIWLIDTTTAEQTQFNAVNPFNNLWPVWTHNGLFILFSQSSPEANVPFLSGLRIEDQARSRDFRIPPRTPVDGAVVMDASVSLDNEWILYTSLDGQNTEIYRMAFNGAGIQRLTNDKSADFGAVWRPVTQLP
jgi:serine/threonine protein kinase